MTNEKDPHPYAYASLSHYYDVLDYGPNEIGFNTILERILRKYHCQRVLDVTCGTGLQVIHLHQAGFDVVGTDLSAELIDIAKKKAPQIDFRQGDMTTIQVGTFDAVISIFNAIGHLDRDTFDRALQNMHTQLQSKGIIIFDIHNKHYLANHCPKEPFLDGVKELGETNLARFFHYRFNPENDRLSIDEKTFIQEPQKPLQEVKLYFELQTYSKDELVAHVEKNGFTVLEVMGFDGKPFDDQTSPSVVIVGQKK